MAVGMGRRKKKRKGKRNDKDYKRTLIPPSEREQMDLNFSILSGLILLTILALVLGSLAFDDVLWQPATIAP